MIYKNTPRHRLCTIMCARFFMDYAAAGNDFAHRRFANAWAIIRARYAYFFTKHRFRRKRIENLRHTTVHDLQTISRRSIVWDYFVKHKKV